MCKLKADKKKKSMAETAYIIVLGSSNTPNSHLLPLADSFDFNLFFLILPNVISNNMPVSFFIKYFRFSFGFYIALLYPFY